MNQVFFNFDVKISYGKSPIKIQAISEYDRFKHLSEKSNLVVNNKFVVDSGKKWFDLVQFADSFKFAISENVKNLLVVNKITGWSTFPIEIENNINVKYFAFFVTETVGEITNLEELNNYETEKHEFDISTWNGSDFFSNKNSLNIVCTERVKELFEKEKITNVEFEIY